MYSELFCFSLACIACASLLDVLFCSVVIRCKSQAAEILAGGESSCGPFIIRDHHRSNQTQP